MPKGLVRAADRVALWVEAGEDDPPILPPGAPPAPAPVGGPAPAPSPVDPPAVPPAPGLPKPGDQPGAPALPGPADQPAPPPPPAPPAPGDYTVQPGDTLSGIAQGHAVPGGYGDIVKANPGPLGTQGTDIASNPNLIHPGDVLKMPGSPPASPAAPSPPASPPTPPPPAPAAPDPGPAATASPPAAPASPAGLPGGLFNPGGLGGLGAGLSGLLGGGFGGLLGGGLPGLLSRGMGNPGSGGAGPMGMSPRTTHAPYPSYAPAGQAPAAGSAYPRTTAPAMHTPTANPANWSHPYAADTGGALRPETQGVLTNLQRQFPNLADVGGYRHPDGFNEHSSGSALDVMLHGADGNTVKDWALRQPGVDYVLFNRRQWNPDGSSSLMPDRGSPTENHMDHTHIHVARVGSVQDLEAQIAKLAAEEEWEQQLLPQPEPAPTSESPSGAPAISKSKKFLQPAKALKTTLETTAHPSQGFHPESTQAVESLLTNKPDFTKTYFKPHYQDMLKSHLGDENYQKLLHHAPTPFTDALTTHTQQPAPKSKKWSVPVNQLKKILDDPHTETSHVTDWLQGQGAPFAKSYLKPGYDDALKSHLGEQKYHELQQHLNTPSKAPEQVQSELSLGQKAKAIHPDFIDHIFDKFAPEDQQQNLLAWAKHYSGTPEGKRFQKLYDEHFGQPEQSQESIGTSLNKILPGFDAAKFDQNPPEAQQSVIKSMINSHEGNGAVQGLLQQLHDEHFGQPQPQPIHQDQWGQSGEAALEHQDKLHQLAEEMGSQHHYYTDVDDYKAWEQGLSPAKVHLFLNHPEQAKDDFEKHLTDYHGDPDSEYDDYGNDEIEPADLGYGDEAYDQGDEPDWLQPEPSAGLLANEISKIFPQAQTNNMSTPQLKAQLEQWLKYLPDHEGYAAHVPQLQALYDQHFGGGQQPKPGAGMPFFDEYDKLHEQEQQQQEPPQHHKDHAQILDSYGEPSEEFKQWFAKDNSYQWGENPSVDKELLKMLADPENKWTQQKVKGYLKSQQYTDPVFQQWYGDQINADEGAWDDESPTAKANLFNQFQNEDPDLKKHYEDVVAQQQDQDYFGQQSPEHTFNLAESYEDPATGEWTHNESSLPPGLKAYAEEEGIPLSSYTGAELQDLLDAGWVYLSPAEKQQYVQAEQHGQPSDQDHIQAIQDLQQPVHQQQPDHQQDLDSMAQAQQGGQLNKTITPSEAQLLAWGVKPSSAKFLSQQPPNKFWDSVDQVLQKKQQMGDEKFYAPGNYPVESHPWAAIVKAVSDLQGQQQVSAKAPQDLQALTNFFAQAVGVSALTAQGSAQAIWNATNGDPAKLAEYLQNKFPAAMKKWQQWQHADQSAAGGAKDQGAQERSSGPAPFDPHVIAKEVQAADPDTFGDQWAAAIAENSTPEQWKSWLKSWIQADYSPEETAQYQKVYDKYFGNGAQQQQTPGFSSEITNIPQSTFTSEVPMPLMEGGYDAKAPYKWAPGAQAWLAEQGITNPEDVKYGKLEQLYDDWQQLDDADKQKYIDMESGASSQGGAQGAGALGGAETAKSLTSVDWNKIQPGYAGWFHSMLEGKSPAGQQAVLQEFAAGSHTVLAPAAQKALDTFFGGAQQTPSAKPYSSSKAWSDWKNLYPSSKAKSTFDDPAKAKEWVEHKLSLKPGTPAAAEKKKQIQQFYDKHFGQGPSQPSQGSNIKAAPEVPKDWVAGDGTYTQQALDYLEKVWGYNTNAVQSYQDGWPWNTLTKGTAMKPSWEQWKADHPVSASQPVKPNFDWEKFGPEFMALAPNSSWGKSSHSEQETQQKLTKAVSNANAQFPGTEKTKNLNELYQKWFPGGSPPGGSSTPAPPPAPKSSVSYQNLLSKSDSLKHLFSDKDRAILKSPEFRNWFDQAPDNYRSHVEDNPGVALDDYEESGGSSYPSVPAGSKGKPKYYDMSPFALTPKPTKAIPKAFTHNPPRGDFVKFPQQQDAQETLPLGPGQKWAPGYEPLPIYRILNLDLDHKIDPSRAPAHIKAQGSQAVGLWTQQQGARLRRIDHILNGDAAHHDPQQELQKFKSWGAQSGLSTKEITDLANVMFGQQGDLFADDKWQHIKGLADKHPDIDMSELHDLAAKLDVLPPSGSKGNYDHPELGQLILDYLENTAHRNGEVDAKSQGGLGWHWTRAINKMYKGVPDASIDKSDMRATNRNVPVALSGLWAGQGEGEGHGSAYNPDHPGELEHNLLSHAPVHLRRVQIRAPGTENQGYGSWHDVIDHGPISLWGQGRYEEGDEKHRSDYAPDPMVKFKPSLAEEVTKATGTAQSKELDALQPGHQADLVFSQLIHDHPQHKEQLLKLYRDFFVGRPDLPTKPHTRRASLQRHAANPHDLDPRNPAHLFELAKGWGITNPERYGLPGGYLGELARDLKGVGFAWKSQVKQHGLGRPTSRENLAAIEAHIMRLAVETPSTQRSTKSSQCQIQSKIEVRRPRGVLTYAERRL